MSLPPCTACGATTLLHQAGCPGHRDLKPANLRLAVVPSSQMPDALSLRPVDADGRAAGYLKHELRDAGFEPGDVVKVVLVRRPSAPAGARPKGSWPQVATGEKTFQAWEEHERQDEHSIPADSPAIAAELWTLVRSEQSGDRDYFSVCVRDEALGQTWVFDVDLEHSVRPVARFNRLVYDATTGGAR